MDKRIDTSPTVWQLYTTTADAMRAIVDACKAAKSSIYIEQFLFTPDSFTEELLELLAEKSRQGVTVKCIFDSYGSLGLGQSAYIDELMRAGVKIKFFNWMFPFSKNNKRFWYFRNHRRLVVVDRAVMCTGGVCMSKEMENWRETHIRVEGPVVQQATNVFDTTWKRVYRKHTLVLGSAFKTGLGGFSYITHAPLPAERHLYYRLIDAIRHAHTSIYLTTPYFVPDRRLMRVLLLAKRRGVDVRILTPRHSNHSLVDKASHTFFHRLLSRSIKIYLYNDMIHAKTAVIDGYWSMVGTLNLDNVSLRYNFEAGIVSTTPALAQELQEHFYTDMRHAREVTLTEWDERPYFQKLAELVAWPLRGFL